MRKTKIIIGLVLMLSMVFGLTAPAYVVKADSMLNCPITVTEKYDEANELFQLVNQERSARGLDPFVYDTGVADYAMQRAAEQSIHFDHQRPDGTMVPYGENIATGYGSASSLVFRDWMNSSGHRSLILRKSMIGGDPIQYAGVGVVHYNGSSYWVLNVSDEPVSGNTTRSSGDKTVNRTFNFNVDKLGWRMRFFRRQRRIVFKETEDVSNWQHQWVIMSEENDGVSAFTGYSIPVSMLNFSVDNENVLKVNPVTGALIPINRGNANVTVSLRNYPQVSTTIACTVYGYYFDGVTASVDCDTVTYTGKPIKPNVTVKDKYGDTLVENRDYTLVYKNNVEPGQATVEIRGMGNYILEAGDEGCLLERVYFTINEAPKPTPTPSPKPTQPPVKPTKPPVRPTQPPVRPTQPPVRPTQPPVRPTQPPVKPTKPPVKPTQAPSKPTKVTPGTVKLVSAAPSAYNKITVKWNKTSGATNYKIYYRKSGSKKWTGLATVNANTTQYTHTASSSKPIVVGQKYDYTVKAYNSKYKTNGKYDAKGKTTYTKPTTVKLKKAALNSKKNAVTVSWNKASGCNYYAVYRKTPSTGWKRLTNVKNRYTSWTDKNPVKGQKNIYTVRAYYSPTKTLGNYNSKGVSVRVR